MISGGFYAEWRARHWAAHALEESSDGSPATERLLQLIWQHQRLKRDQLVTVDGRPIRILHPGFWNHESGPDFRGAIIQHGDALARHGDVEVDLSPHGWRAHGHDRNAAYQNVILQVVWAANSPSPGRLPILAVGSQLDAPLEELSLWLRNEPRPAPNHLQGKCASKLQQLSSKARTELFQESAAIRLQSKAKQLQARARQVGWDQSLWEGLFGALGFKNNIWPMRRLAELLPALCTGLSATEAVLNLQARLLGVGNMLPSDLNAVTSHAYGYLRQLWSVWWREREQFADLVLPSSAWHLAGIRPANHPQRRLALAAHWLAAGDLPVKLEQWFAQATPDASLPRALRRVLEPGEDPFWSRHWTFHSAPKTDAQPMIGPQRVTDIAVNVVLPWFWIRAVTGQNQTLQRLAEACYFA